MLRRLKTMATAFGFVALSSLSMPTTAVAYPVDCAILLCLSGGWPASAECSHARAVFIRRITPWPIEPPLQIWRCPMRSAHNEWGTVPSRSQIYQVSKAKQRSLQGQYPNSEPTDGQIKPLIFRNSDKLVGAVVQQVAAGDGADIDISNDPAFDYVRSIKVWDVNFVHGGRDCEDYYWSIRKGSYDAQAAFSWSRSTPGATPRFVLPSTACRTRVRAIGVEWRDFEGNHGYEVVNY